MRDNCGVMAVRLAVKFVLMFLDVEALIKLQSHFLFKLHQTLLSLAQSLTCYSSRCQVNISDNMQMVSHKTTGLIAVKYSFKCSKRKCCK